MANLQTSTVHPTEDTPSTSGGYSYEVFISHRGPDLKNTFASHAYHRLLSHGVRPFFDREELRKGESLSPQIEAAIRTAPAHIAIFSPGYADSKWCLDELSLICKSGVTIIPVFYNVEPCELRWTGRYAKALTVHEQKGRYEPKRLEDWRKALKDVSEISGFELKTYNGDEGKLLDDLVKCILKKLRKTGLTVATYPTGLEEKVADFEKILSLQEGQSGKVKVMGIVGMGGIGKTTLAKELFNKKCSNFGESCFLFDVREYASRGSLNSLQRKLMKDLAHIEVRIDHIDEGTEVLKASLKTSHALVVIDDVDHADQLNVFLPLKDVLRSDSLILVTSRYKDVLTSSGLVESSIYRMTGLNEQHSQELFCSYAFCNPHSPSEFKDLVDEFCRACDGLPLSLKVFGSSLCGRRDKSYWEGLLNKLRQIKLPNEVQQTLKLSYDALEEEEKQIFLEIACYFIGEDRDMAIRIWDGSGWNGQLGFANLQDRCLVDVDTENNTIKMHDHLRDLGRQIVDQQKSGGVIPHREWRVMKDIPELWRQYSNEQVITEVRGIRTVHRLNADPELSAEGSSWSKSWCEEVFRNCFRKLNCLRKLNDPSPYLFSKLQLVATEGDDLKSILSRVDSPNLIWLRWSDCPYNCLPPWLLNLMKNVRVLEVSGKKLGTLWRTSQAPLDLRELTIHSSDSPLFEFPKSIGQLKHIEKIVVHAGGVKLLPKEFCDLHSLKYLDLSGSWRLRMLPDSFGCLTNLVHLDLSSSWSLQMLPNSFGNLICLKYLNLDQCSQLTISNETFANVRSLEELHLLGTNLQKLPEDIGNLRNLEVLTVGSHSLKELPCSLGHLSRLKHMELVYCRELKSLPDSLGLLTQLSELKIEECGIESLPPEMEKLSNLVKLTVESCPIRELPLKSGVEGALSRLEYLELRRTEISKICLVEGVCPTLKHLYIIGCSDKLRKIEGLYNLTNLQGLHIRGCKELEELPCLERLISLKWINLWDCDKVSKMEGLHNLTNLQELHIHQCKELEELPCLERLISLKRIKVIGCDKVRKMEGLHNLTNLQELHIWRCKELEELPCLERCISLKWINLWGCDKVSKMEGLHNLTNLQELQIRWCKELEELPCLERLVSLKWISLWGCDKLRKMEGLHNLTNLQQLWIKGCKELEELPCLERLISLKKITVDECRKLKRIEGLGQLTQLEECSVVVYIDGQPQRQQQLD